MLTASIVNKILHMPDGEHEGGRGPRRVLPVRRRRAHAVRPQRQRGGAGGRGASTPARRTPSRTSRPTPAPTRAAGATVAPTAAASRHGRRVSGALRIGSRGSKLALIQSEWVRDELQRAASRACASRSRSSRPRATSSSTRRWPRSATKGLFTKELETAMLDGRTDLAVHSAKDMPTEVPEGLAIVAFTAREDVRDVFVGRAAPAAPRSLDDLPRGARVGTSSLRRRSQLLALRPDLDSSTSAATSRRACASSRSRAWPARSWRPPAWRASSSRSWPPFAFAFHQMLPAVGQGSLAIEARADDARVARAGRAADARAAPLWPCAPSAASCTPWRAAARCRSRASPRSRERRTRPGVDQLLLRAFVGSSTARRPCAGSWRGRRRRPKGSGSRSPTTCWRAAPTGSSQRSAESPDMAHGRPLAGKTVVVTRPREQAASLAEPLEHLGAEVLLAPTIRIVPRDARRRDRARRRQRSRRTTGSSSSPASTASDVFLGYLAERRPAARGARRRHRGGRRADGPRPPSRNAASPATWWPTSSSPRVCSTALEKRAVAPAGTGCSSRGAAGAPRAPRRAARERRSCDVLPVYDTVPAERLQVPAAQIESADFITFTSSSTAQQFVALMEAAGAWRTRRRRPAARRAALRRRALLHRPRHQRDASRAGAAASPWRPPSTPPRGSWRRSPPPSPASPDSGGADDVASPRVTS